MDLHSTPEVEWLSAPTEDTISQLQSDAVTPHVTDTPSTTSKSLTTNRLQTLLQMQKTDPFCKLISK